ncbi:MAG: DUF3078 domain-containing protein, partial [Bacteroidales bacterium]
MGDQIILDRDQALDLIEQWYKSEDKWKSEDHPLRLVMGRLLFEATNDPLYRAEHYLRDLSRETITIPSDRFFLYDTLHILVDPNARYRGSGKSWTIPSGSGDDITGNLTDSLSAVRRSHADSLLAGKTFQRDSLIAIPVDSIAVPMLVDMPVRRVEMIDSIVLVVKDTLTEVINPDPAFPFTWYDYPMTGDSIYKALNILMDIMVEKDSSLLVFKGSQNAVPVWLDSRAGRLYRLWLENEWGEALSVWVGNSGRDTVTIAAERGVHFRRLGKETNIANAKMDAPQIESRKLAEVTRLDVTPNYWKFLSETAFTFNQAMIKNWSKGGESNVAFTIDLEGIADYTNKQKKISWVTVGRFKYGYMASGKKENRSAIDVRKNVDLIDVISKYNAKAFGKFDFSGTMIFKTQLTAGYAYPDTVMISKFMNPGSLTLGIGLNYKPNKNTSINFAPLSYKGTFVLDTVNIDQTKHGLLADQRSRHEPGVSAQIDHKMTIFDDLTLVNRLRLFTNYIDNPQNMDIEWEMIASMKLNWYTDLRLNTHFIYDDDTLIPVYDSEGEKVLDSEGKHKKVPMV